MQLTQTIGSVFKSVAFCYMQFGLWIQCSCSFDPMNVLIKSNEIYAFCMQLQKNYLRSGDVMLKYKKKQ